MLNKIFEKTKELFEYYLPLAFLMILLFSFCVGIFSRYVIKEPQSWTYEADSIAFFVMAMLSTCLVSRDDENVVFDLIYNKFGPRTQNILRVATDFLVTVFAAVLLPFSVKFVDSLSMLSTQLLKLPRGVPFLAFCVMLVFTIYYNGVRLVRDIKSLKTEKNEEGKAGCQ